MPHLRTDVRPRRADPALPVRQRRREGPFRPATVHHLGKGGLIMCATCGCTDLDEPGPLSHDHDHEHDHGRTVTLQQKILAKNDDLAQHNREWLRERGVLAINLMSSPGSGKTTLLERTGRDLAGKLALSVVESDQSTPMRGASLNTEIGGVRALSAARPAYEQLGLVGFNGNASSYMSP